jgi:superfamily I DNA/RNA helicase
VTRVAGNAPTKDTRKWSALQEAIFAWFESGEGHLTVTARAGSGKTSTSVEGINRAPEGNIWFAAYNKHIQVEMEKRLENPAAVAKTIHAIGYACIKRKWGDEAQGVDNDRAYRLADEALADPRVVAEVRAAPPPESDKLIPEFRHAPYVSREVGGAVASVLTKVREVAPFAFREECALAVAQVEDVMAQYDLLPEEVLERHGWSAARIAVAALHAVRAAAEFKDRRFDFADMLFLPLVNGWCYPRFDMVVVDEHQDMSEPMLAFVRKMLKAHGRIALVGDEMQAIYSFRGADSAAAVRLAESLGAAPLPLNITYRCPQAVVREAQRLVPDFYAAPGAPEGVVREIKVMDLAAQVQVGDFVLSRVNAPLLRVALDVMLQKKPVCIVGRQIGDALVKLVGKIHRGVAPIGDFLEALQDYREDAVERLGSSKERSAKSKLEKLLDQVEALEFLARGLSDAGGSPDTGALVTKIRMFFSEQDPRRCVTLSTVHGAKGLERDRVFILRDTLYVYGMRAGESEERNIEYVAITRAKKELVWVVGRPGQQDDPPSFRVEE